MDDQQRARELLAAECDADGFIHLAKAIRDGESSKDVERSLRAITAALRAAPDAVALRVAMETLEQISGAPDDRGARFNAVGAVAFLKTQGVGGSAAPEVPAARAAEPEGFGSLPIIDHVRHLAETHGAHVRYWAEAYGPQATEPHFQGHGMVAALLAEYADLLERLAARPQGVK